MGVRKYASTLSTAEKAGFIAAIRQFKANGRYDQYVAQYRNLLR